MKITVLTDNVAGAGFLAEHGLSYYIDAENTELLFDTGSSNVFLHNAKQLGISVDDIETVVLSHGHWDHGNGLQYVEGKKLITHPLSFQKRYRKNDNSYIGLAISEEQTHQKFEVISSASPYKITEHIYFLGEIPRKNSFEAQTTAFVDDKGEPDFVPDDSALAIVENNALTIISGCAHAGICNTIEYAKNVTGVSEIKSVLGGFHLKHANKQTKDTIEYLQKQQITNLYPSHCTELPALSLFFNAFGITQLKTGMQVEI